MTRTNEDEAFARPSIFNKYSTPFKRNQSSRNTEYERLQEIYRTTNLSALCHDNYSLERVRFTRSSLQKSAVQLTNHNKTRQNGERKCLEHRATEWRPKLPQSSKLASHLQSMFLACLFGQISMSLIGLANNSIACDWLLLKATIGLSSQRGII